MEMRPGPGFRALIVWLGGGRWDEECEVWVGEAECCGVVGLICAGSGDRSA